MNDPTYASFKDPDSDQNLAKENLAAHIRTQWQIFRNHRSSIGLKDQLLQALQTYNGQYNGSKLAEITKFGGSTVFARITTIKCRGATSMLRDVFLGAKRPWDVEPTPVPVIPDSVTQDIRSLVMSEAEKLLSVGQPPTPAQIQQRVQQLTEAAGRAALKTAKEQAKQAARKLDDYLVEGNFYEAMGEFLVDLPIFKFAVIKGPLVKMQTGLAWVNGKVQVSNKPKLYWQRVSPFDVYFSPGVSRIEDSDVIEKFKITRSDLNALLGLPGYDEQAIRSVLRDYGMGLVDFIDDNDGQVADEEGRENPHLNQSNLLDGVEYHGKVQGSLLRQYGFGTDEVADPDKDYAVDAWLVGRYLIKVQLNPNPKKRHPYYVTSYEKVPGSLIGHGLPELIQDIQDVGNASLRSLVNNMSIASGPQVVINEELLSPATDANTLYPWKRWRYKSDPFATNSAIKPVDFFQPSSNSNELMAVYQKMMDLADEVSAIPRYITGSEKVGGAASTASGLSMLMGNASKVLQNVASQIDHDIMAPLLEDLYTMVMLTDTSGMLRGDESIAVKGVAVAIQKETDRMRKLEFLQITGNPLDMQVIGLEGRAAVLRAIADDLGMPEAEIVPSEDELRARLEQQAAIAAAESDDPNAHQAERLRAEQGQQGGGQETAPAAQGNPAPKPNQGRGRMASSTDNMHRTRNM